jgi:TusA-related sulfurtransferase
VETITQLVRQTGAPDDHELRELDVSDLPPPQPLQDTLSALEAGGDGLVLVQYNDRAPQHLFPMLADRGYEYETVEQEDRVVTVIWEP